MKSINLRLDPDTREELYSDIHEAVIDFILLEALVVIVNDFTSNEEKLKEAIDDPEYYLNDPDANISASVEYLLDVLKTVDELDGTDVNSPDYNIQEHSGWISDKLILAINSITAANPAIELLTIDQFLKDPSLLQGMTVKGTHLNNLVVLMVSPTVKQTFI